MSNEEIKLQLDQINELLNVLVKKMNQMNNVPMNDYLKTKEACKYMNMSPNTFTKMCVNHQIYPKKIDGSHYYSIYDLKSVFN
jgi:hypothetical protein